ncbi:carbohydrate ABC transporter permease [Allofournierella sp.]|uniref:carbohydrate ABC transporter permease n=1 Tax=Allofournierella sp. TaxID=1940256 RepID=UPI003AB3A5B7
MKTKFSWKGALGRLPVRLVMVSLALSVVFPLVWNLYSSLKSNTEIMADPWALPTALHWENYLSAFQKASMGDYFLNSIFVVVLATALHLLLVIPITYALSRYRFFGSKLLLAVLMACIFIQEPYILVPLYLQLSRIHLLDNLIALAVIYATVRMPFSVFLLSGFMKSIPVDYEQAAMIDGCSYTRNLWRIVAPLAKPGIFTVGLLAALGYWNEYAIALTMISSETKYTLPVGLVNLYEVQRYATDWGALFAGLMIVLIPSVIVYIFAQERLTQGMSMGGIKE